jgi:RES domain-containing protein
MVAVREANQAFVDKLQPCVLCSYEVDCDDIVDLATDAGRKDAGVAYDQIAAAWLDYLDAGREPPQWAIVRVLRTSGAAGAVVPSFAPGATPDDRNLVLWSWGPDLPHRVVVIDTHGRLPKNDASWV